MGVGFVSVDGGNLAYERDGAGEAVVFLHGLGLDRGVWNEVVRDLGPSVDAIRVDQRGHGQSSDPDEPYFPHDDVLRVLDALAIERAHLVGLSMGGAVALDVALARPERVRSLALVDSALNGHDWSAEWVKAFHAVRRAAAESGAEAGKSAWAAHPLFEGEHGEIARRDSGRRWTGPNFACPLEPLAGSRLGEVRARTLVIVGDRDLPDFQAIARVLHAGIAHSRFEMLEGVGHLAPVIAPGRVAALLEEHFREP